MVRQATVKNYSVANQRTTKGQLQSKGKVLVEDTKVAQISAETSQNNFIQYLPMFQPERSERE